MKTNKIKHLEKEQKFDSLNQISNTHYENLIKRFKNLAYLKKEYKGQIEKFLSIINKFKNKKGVYIFYCDHIPGVPIYIGMSVNILERILSHLFSGSEKSDSSHFSCYIAKTASDAFILESFLISKYKPELNGAGVFKDNVCEFDLGINLKDLELISIPRKLTCNYKISAKFT